jgi:Protein of unknown function (DUF4245)
VTSPDPLRKPDRTELGVRHMLGATGLLVAIVLGLALFTRGFGFAPAGPSVDPASAPVVDAPARLRQLAATTPFPLQAPAVPPGWRSNSVGVDRVGDARAVRVGYLTPAGSYVQLQQSDAPEDALLHADAGTRVLVAQGPRDVGGRQWVVYGTRPGEPVWIADTGRVRWAITGSGTDADYAALAAALH